LTFLLELVAEAGGRLSAHFDLALGHHRQLPFGHSSPLTPYYDRVLWGRYAIEVRNDWPAPVDGIWNVWPEAEILLGHYAEGYNTVSEKAANRKFGKDVADAAFWEAVAEFRAHPPPPR
jgi:hypothetical protein